MPKMYHPTIPSTYDDPRPVTMTAFKAVWEPNGWRLEPDEEVDEPEVEDLLAAVSRDGDADDDEEE